MCNELLGFFFGYGRFELYDEMKMLEEMIYVVVKNWGLVVFVLEMVGFFFRWWLNFNWFFF